VLDRVRQTERLMALAPKQMKRQSLGALAADRRQFLQLGNQRFHGRCEFHFPLFRGWQEIGFTV